VKSDDLGPKKNPIPIFSAEGGGPKKVLGGGSHPSPLQGCTSRGDPSKSTPFYKGLGGQHKGARRILNGIAGFFGPGAGETATSFLEGKRAATQMPLGPAEKLRPGAAPPSRKKKKTKKKNKTNKQEHKKTKKKRGRGEGIQRGGEGGAK